MGKLNCWEFMNCGMDRLAPEDCPCPVPRETRLDGVNSGTMGGRACWVVAGTQCHGKLQGLFAEKIGNCLDCPFYQKVIQEEGENYTDTSTAYLRLNRF